MEAKTMTYCTVGDYLLLRLVQVGIKHIFGVPGDYNMEFLDFIIKQENLKWIGNCNELNAAYAADGYARINGIAALVTTFGVGELSAINGIAGAYAEYVPVVAITGSPATKKQSSGAPLHHTVGTGDFTIFAQMFEKVTVAQAYLTAENATAEIDRVLGVCLLKKQPVYISLPMDVATTEVAAPAGEFMPPVFESDSATLDEAVDVSVTMLEKAEKPVILADIGVDRYRLHNELRELLAATGYPYATMSMGKALLEETHPQYIGIYNGAVSNDYVRRRIEEADCVLSIGTYFTDFNTGKFSAQLEPSRTIEVHGEYLKIKRALYNQVAMRDFLPALSKKLQHREAISLDIKPAKDNSKASYQVNADAPIKQERFWQRLTNFFKEDDIVVADIGVAYFGSLLVNFPKGTTFVGQLLWASIGYSLGAVLGCAIASPQRRSILFIGDGSFQMTAQELSTLLRYDLKPIIFLINNDGYTIERDIHGEKMPYNDIQRWKYHQLPEVFGNNSWSAKVSSESELETALQTASENRDKLIFIEVVMGKMENPENLLKLLQQ
ncbi:alpha-keto acid decarboxylase family protein [Microcoleus vaginatus GB2-A3]|uniref:alpha-keto acid decarboxylase family protein n=1 Tax=Microcoleus vaginatus TaxID=119532 RepID=UPI0032ABC4A4